MSCRLLPVRINAAELLSSIADAPAPVDIDRPTDVVAAAGAADRSLMLLISSLLSVSTVKRIGVPPLLTTESATLCLWD